MISNSGTTSLGLYDLKRQIDAFGGVDYFRPTLAGGYLLNARVMLANGDIVKSTIDGNTHNPNSDMTGWVKTNSASQIFDKSGLSQQDINDGVESIAELIAIPNPKNGTRVFLKSYHAGGKRGGSRYFVYDKNGRRDSHNGGTVIDPNIPVPSLATFNTYFTPRVTNNLGVWVQESSTSLILASEFGAIPADDMFWNCACVNAALRFAQRNSLVNIDGSTVKVEHGVYQTTNPIVNTSIFAGNRCPALIGGDNFLDVTFIKTTNNTVGSGYVGGDVDAVIYVSPTTANGNYVIGEHTSGFELRHSTALANTGYGYYARNSVIAYRGNILGRNNYHNIFQDDCWQTTYGEIWSVGGSYGITAKYATSCIGGPLYVDGAKLGGFDFTSLTYSDLVCACDKVGFGLADGGIAYNFKEAKGVTGSFSTEYHKGAEFYFENSVGLNLSGRSFGTTAVTTSATKVSLNTGTKNSVDFSGYDWSSTNLGITETEFLKYEFTNHINYTYFSALKFNACGFPEDNPVFMKKGLGIPHGKMQTQVSYSGFSHVDGLMTTTMYVQNLFDALCFVGGVSSIEFLTYYCIDSGKDFGATFAGKASNRKRFLIGGISTDQNSPTVIGTYIVGSTQTTNTLEAYIDSNNWLRVRNGNSVNNGNYRIVMST